MIVSLQYLRAFAAIMVVMFHVCAKLSRMAGADQALAFPVGLTGVDVFFVISGFISSSPPAAAAPDRSTSC